MNTFFLKFRAFFNTIRSKIAFYPVLLSICGVILSFAMIWLETTGLSNAIRKALPQLMVEDGDTALSVLTTCIGGLISMMVFSFSMVMLLLSQASSNYSPRLLPGLISDRRHQMILGFYMATILYCMFTLFTIRTAENEYALPGTAVLLAISMTIACLGLFIAFIHGMSQQIQINNILDRIYDQARDRLTDIVAAERANRSQADIEMDFTDWHPYLTEKSGYLQNISLTSMHRLAEELDTRLYFSVPKGLFVLKNRAFVLSERALGGDEVKRIASNINFSRDELITDNYVLAFKQITEIAVKAMSPGINDPGTAVNAIDYLTELIALRMQKKDIGNHASEEKTLIRVAIIRFEELMYNMMASLRTYCAHDPTVAQKLMAMLAYLKEQEAVEDHYRLTIDREIALLINDTEQEMASEWDFEVLKRLVPSDPKARNTVGR